MRFIDTVFLATFTFGLGRAIEDAAVGNLSDAVVTPKYLDSPMNVPLMEANVTENGTTHSEQAVEKEEKPGLVTKFLDKLHGVGVWLLGSVMAVLHPEESNATSTTAMPSNTTEENFTLNVTQPPTDEQTGGDAGTTTSDIVDEVSAVETDLVTTPQLGNEVTDVDIDGQSTASQPIAFVTSSDMPYGQDNSDSEDQRIKPPPFASSSEKSEEKDDLALAEQSAQPTSSFGVDSDPLGSQQRDGATSTEPSVNQSPQEGDGVARHPGLTGSTQQAAKHMPVVNGLGDTVAKHAGPAGKGHSGDVAASVHSHNPMAKHEGAANHEEVANPMLIP